MIACLNKLDLNWDTFWQFLRELGREFQEWIAVAVKEDVYCEVLWINLLVYKYHLVTIEVIGLLIGARAQYQFF